jgi:heterodisulfide reductase subunit A-like polyferredoxin
MDLAFGITGKGFSDRRSFQKFDLQCLARWEGDVDSRTRKKVGAILVAGGGIAGMQASLDAAAAGFKVYLVERDISIGGVMAQLDKTFPTNDCSTCLISPKLIEVARHPDIEILTQTEIDHLEGEAGHFTVTLRREPRYIDAAKCNACGACAEACPVSLPSSFDEGLGRRPAAYRHFPQAVPSTFAIKKYDRAPCGLTCPAAIKVQGYVQLIKIGKYADAVKLIMERLPLPGVLGRICPHPCEEQCRRREIDEPVAICGLKRFAADQVDLSAISPPLVAARSDRIAIIGSGPAGLACAYHLARRGYRPTIFEALPKAGGMLRVGIPDYRLPKEVLDREIDYILRLGVELKTNTALGRDFTLDGLFEQGYKAVFLGIGCHVGKQLGIPGEEAAGVIQGVEFLRRHNLGEPLTVGRSLAVIGGGNVAMDVACTARRLGSKVTIVYRRGPAEMPAFAHEIDQATCEGVEIVYLAAPLQVITAGDGKVTGLLCQKMELGEADASGRRQPVPLAHATFELPVDMVVPAIGQEAAPETFQACGVKGSRWGTIAVNEVTYETSRPGVFAAGDVHTGPWIAIEAVAGGIEAAESIDRYLQGVDLAAGRTEGQEAHHRWAEIPRDAEGQPREMMSTLPPDYTCSCFDEIARGYTEEQARKEASRCLNCGGCSECGQCVTACQAGAIDHQQQPSTQTLNVGAVILAPGFRPFDAAGKAEYGYGRYPNVITSLEFERTLSATGPFGGHVQRPGDGKEPKKIAWIQCVGSRDASIGREYCSYVCCMYAAKQAIIAREHDPRIEPTIFFIDFRAQGKGFDRYYERARDEHGVRLVRGMISRVAQDPQTHNLELNYVDAGGCVQAEEFDLVVLSVGLSPHPAAAKLAQVCGIATDKWGFVASPPFRMVETSRPGIYTCGVFQAPKDIPETVGQASAAAGAAAALLREARGTLLSKAEYPREGDISSLKPRLGVFVCHCGINIAGVVDVARVTEYARTLPGVVYADHYTFTCATDSLEKMRQVIETESLNRVVVASCSPRTHEAMFQDNLRKAGLNKYLFEMANIRDQDSWVHQNDPALATEKARELVKMAVARAAVLAPLTEMAVPVNQRALVVGGGLAGLVAALTIADAGYRVYLPDLQERLGGSLARRMRHTLEGHAIQPFMWELVTRVETHPNIRWWEEARILNFSGHQGNFRCELESPRGKWSVHVGAVVIATGGQEYSPKDYLYGEHSRVLTQIELEALLADSPEELAPAPTIVMIQCVGSRSPEHPYCSRVCCGEAIKNALKIKEIRPQARVFILYRDIRTYGLKEIYYKKARDLGVQFVRYEPERPPEAVPAGEAVKVTVFDQNLRRDLKFTADYLVLSAAIRPHPVTREVAGLLKLPLDADGFLMEAHLKLRPLDFAVNGIFLCGLAHSPKFIEESVAQAQGAAARALGVLAQEVMYVGGAVAVVDPQKCAICLTCLRTCPFGVPRVDQAEGVVTIDPAACQGCGSCASACPRKAIEVMHHRDDQFLSKIWAIQEGGHAPGPVPG